jgi:hypothetical protein
MRKIKRFFISLLLTIVICAYIGLCVYILDWALTLMIIKHADIGFIVFVMLLIIGIFCLPLTINLIKNYKENNGGE